DRTGALRLAAERGSDASLDAGMLTMQSTPIVGSGGMLIGIVSTHAALARRPGEQELRWLHLLPRQAADFLERKRTQEQMLGLTTGLREPDRRRHEFVAVRGPELRTPRAGTLPAPRVRDVPRATAETSARAHDVIRRQSRQLTRIVDDLLDVARVAAGKI